MISSSWGLCEVEEAALGGGSSLTAEDQLFEQAATQEQSIIAAAGDNGSEDCADPIEGDSLPAETVDDPKPSQPFVTGAGGTRLAVDASGARSAEIAVWSDGPMVETTARGAGGGGVSTQWGMPVWQYTALNDEGWLPPTQDGQSRCLLANSTSNPSATSSEPYCREVPDTVPANADPESGLRRLLERRLDARRRHFGRGPHMGGNHCPGRLVHRAGRPRAAGQPERGALPAR